MLLDTRGSIVENKQLAKITWLRVGGPADFFFMPADTQDLIEFLRKLPENIKIFPIGVGSNLIVRDGGIRGVVIRLGSSFNKITFDGNKILSVLFATEYYRSRIGRKGLVLIKRLCFEGSGQR